MKYFSKCTVGSDPELFIINTKTGKVVSSIGLIPGEKNNAYVAPDMPKGFGLEVDNILAEFNIPACKTKEDWIKSMEYMKEYIRSYIKQKNPDLDIKCVASSFVDDDQLQSTEAKLFGCDPDYNAYTEEINPKPKGNNTNLRSAGMHIHIGYPKFNPISSIQLVKYLDVFLGVPSVLYDTDTNRRQLYGKAGSFRLQPWGVEYRVLSSYFLQSPKTLSWVWDQVERAVTAWYNDEVLPSSDIVQKIINTSDVDLASQVVKTYHLLEN